MQWSRPVATRICAAISDVLNLYDTWEWSPRRSAYRERRWVTRRWNRSQSRISWIWSSVYLRLFENRDMDEQYKVIILLLLSLPNFLLDVGQGLCWIKNLVQFLSFVKWLPLSVPATSSTMYCCAAISDVLNLYDTWTRHVYLRLFDNRDTDEQYIVIFE